MLGEHFLVLVTNGLAIKPCIFTVTAHVLSSTCSSCNIHYAHTAMIVGTVLMVNITWYRYRMRAKLHRIPHPPPNITKCLTQALSEITTNKIRFLCFNKAVSLVRLAHNLLSRRVSFWFTGVSMIVGQLRSVFHLIVCGHFLSLFALGFAPLINRCL